MEPVQQIQIEHVIATLQQALDVTNDVDYKSDDCGVSAAYAVGYSRSALQSATEVLTQILKNDSHS